MTGSLLALAPLRLEARAVAAGAPGASVARTGMGPRRSAAAARRLRPTAAPSTTTGVTVNGVTVNGVTVNGVTVNGVTATGVTITAVAVTGVAGALVDGLTPGDLVVADVVLRPSGEVVARLPAAGAVAAELRRAGLVAHVGAVVSTERLVRGRAARARLAAATGAIAVDMESAALLATPWGVPTVVVRAISDRPGQELWSPTTPANGRRALRALRAAAAVLDRWAASAADPAGAGPAPRPDGADVDPTTDTISFSPSLEVG